MHDSDRVRGFLVSHLYQKSFTVDITLDKTSSTDATIKIKLAEPDYQSQVEKKIKDYGKKANLKGFRPGKVPPGLIKKMYGKSILVEEINTILSQNLSDYIKTNELQVLGDPMPNYEKAQTIDWDNQSEFEFEYRVGLAEDFELPLDKNVKVETYTIKVDDKVIDETIENLQQQMGESTNPEVSEEGDNLYGALLNEEAGVEKDVLISYKLLAKKAAKDFVGKKEGDVVSFDPTKAFDEQNDAASITGVDLADLKKVKSDFEFTVKNINRITPAKVDQDLFDKTFGKDVVKDEKEFRERVKEAVSKNYNQEAEIYEKKAIQDKLIEAANFNLPDQFLKDWLLQSNEGKVTQEDIDKEYDQYAKEMRWSLIKNKITKANDIKAEHHDVVEEAKKLIRSQLAASGMAGEQFESNMDAFADNYLKGENGENYMKVYNQVQENKVLDHVKEQITIKQKEITAKEFRNLPLN